MYEPTERGFYFVNTSSPVAAPLLPVSSGASSLGHRPGPRWQFDEGVTAVFDDMLARSIPQLPSMRDVVFTVAKHLVRENTDVVDLGCARGEAIARLIDDYGIKTHFVGVDASGPMIHACRKRFKSMIAKGIVDIYGLDLRDTYPAVRASITLCILTLMFTPVEHRLRILTDALEHSLPGGAFILVEKIFGADARINQLLTNLYHNHKREMGYTQEEIDRKRLSLEGVLVPMTAAWNEELLRAAGFQHIECIWRSLNFAGWVAMKS
jgi:tRNA (cmo5U34)-methyltransferase